MRPLSPLENQGGFKSICARFDAKCLYDPSIPNAVCLNCVHRGLTCGTKLPGPKAQMDLILLPTEEPAAKTDEDGYRRLFERSEKLRESLAPDQTEMLVEFVESGLLREEGKQLVLGSTEGSEDGDNEIGTFLVLFFFSFCGGLC